MTRIPLKRASHVSFLTYSCVLDYRVNTHVCAGEIHQIDKIVKCTLLELPNHFFGLKIAEKKQDELDTKGLKKTGSLASEFQFRRDCLQFIHQTRMYMIV